MKKDQSGALKPNMREPFHNNKDAIKRLVKYHVWQERDENKAQVEAGQLMVISLSH